MTRRALSIRVNLICKHCRRPFSINTALYRQSIQRKAPRRFCSRDCSAAVKRMMPAKSKFRQWADFEEKLRRDILISRPVITLREMSPEKQAEMKRLYERLVCAPLTVGTLF